MAQPLAILAHRRAPVIVAVLGAFLTLPSITTGFVADDHIQRLVVRASHTIPGFRGDPLELFVFADGTEDVARERMAQGIFPWWTDGRVKLSFWRPLASATHLLDYSMWPENPVPHHLHSVLWYALAIVVVALLYRRIMPSAWLAGLAALLYAVDDAHGPTVGWIANRNSLVAATIAFCALIVYDRWRRDGWKPGALLAPVLFAAALLAGEAALAVCGYLFAYALYLDAGPLVRRLARLVPYGLILVVWRVVYTLTGHGTAGSGVYIDPVADPLAFVAALFERGPVLLMGQLATPWSELWAAYPAALKVGFMLGAAACFALWLYVLAPTLRREPSARFWLLGLLLATVPLTATFTADRLLVFVGVGAMPLVAHVLGLFLERPKPAAAARRALLGATALTMFVFHALLAPPLLALRSRSMETVARSLMRADRTIPSGEDVASKSVFLINPPVDSHAAFVPIVREARRQPRPGAMTWLATGASEVSVARVDARTLRVRASLGFQATLAEQMLRSRRNPFVVGETVELPYVHIEITGVDGELGATEASFTFERPLECDEYIWLHWSDDGFVPFELPAVGESTSLPPVDLLSALLGSGLEP